VDYFFRHYDSCCYMPERGRIHHAASNASPISPDHETSSDRRRAACDNRCRLCGLCALLRDLASPAIPMRSLPDAFFAGPSRTRLEFWSP